MGAEKDPPRSARVTTAVAATEPLVRILLNLDADSVPNEFISGFVRRQTNARPSAATCRGRAPRPWNDVTLIRRFERVTLALCALAVGALAIAHAQQPEVRFGGAYSGLDVRRQQLIDNWVARFSKVTGKPLQAGPFYDDVLTVSTKTTFEAVTHALMTTVLTDRPGASLGDALALVDQVDSVRGEVEGAATDRQFRIYVRLTPAAVDILSRSQQFRRALDNSVYHRGYPINYRAQGGVPSIQISVAPDRRHGDIDVDYRSSMFPASLLNGHLTASNSDVRAGRNFDRHLNRWAGFQNWWNNFFGVRQERAPAETESSSTPQRTPRAGRANIDDMVNDFLKAWLIEGDSVTAMGYISERSYACLAQDRDDPSTFDHGQAPFQLMINLRAAHDSLGPHTSLDGLVVGTRLAKPALRVVTQPHHAQFVLYSVPDDVAASFDCASQMTLADPANVRRAYGTYFGATFYLAGSRDTPVALLWAREDGYWKIVSWKVGSDDATTPPPEPVAETKATRIGADPTLVSAANGFLESWLVRKDYGAAFTYLSPKIYECYDLERNPESPAATSSEDAARKLRAALEVVGSALGDSRSLDALLSGVEPFLPGIRVMNHSLARVFTLTSIPNALADASECAARASGTMVPDPLPLEYGEGFGMNVRFKTRSGEAGVLRGLWRKENANWRITSYDIEQP